MKPDFELTTNHADSNLIDIGYDKGECYSAANRIQALSIAAKHVAPDDLICLLDSDIFLYWRSEHGDYADRLRDAAKLAYREGCILYIHRNE